MDGVNVKEVSSQLLIGHPLHRSIIFGEPK